MAMVILIGGSLATGKSTLARNLANELHVMTLIKDDIKEKIVDEIGFTNRNENKKISLATMKVMLYLLDVAMKQALTIIIEANFHQDELAIIKEMINNYHYDYRFIKLTGDCDKLYDRFCHRAKYENRHKAHLSAGLLDFDAFKAYDNDLLDLDYYLPTLEINTTNNTINDVYQQTLAYINKTPQF